MTRAVNDATLTKAGDIYQYLNALRDCFELNDGETLQIEINGDVKANISLFVEMSDSGIFETVDEDIEDLKEKIERLEKKIKGFDVDTKMSKAKSFLSENMNHLAITLDFEEEYRPINLNFGLTDGSFDIYQHQNNRENIYLYEMGSGAN